MVVFLGIMLVITNEVIQGILITRNSSYVAGKYGTHCYPVDDEYAGIKYHVYFKTLEECEKYIETNK